MPVLRDDRCIVVLAHVTCVVTSFVISGVLVLLTCREFVPNQLRLLNEVIVPIVTFFIRPGQYQFPLAFSLHLVIEALLQLLFLQPCFLLRFKLGLLSGQDSGLHLLLLGLQDLLSLFS